MFLISFDCFFKNFLQQPFDKATPRHIRCQKKIQVSKKILEDNNWVKIQALPIQRNLMRHSTALHNKIH